MERRKKGQEDSNSHKSEKENHDAQGESRGLTPAREPQTAVRTTVVDRGGGLMQKRHDSREDHETSGWIEPVPLAERLNIPSTALGTIHCMRRNLQGLPKINRRLRP